MFKNHFYFMSLLALSCVTANADQHIKMDIKNDNDQSLDLKAQTPKGDFAVRQVVPAYARAFIIAEIVKFDTLQEKLFDGICQNSAVIVQQAINAGANIFEPKEGKTPLAWALKLNRFDAAACLVTNGAR